MNEQTQLGQQSSQPSPVPTQYPNHPPAANKALPSFLERHGRKCKICCHPDREDIEQDYRDWLRPSEIARRYNIDDSALHRHLRAVGLASRRRENLRMVLDRILERGAEQPISGDTIIRAVKAYTCLTDDNRWVEPERRIVYVREEPAPQKAAEIFAGSEGRGFTPAVTALDSSGLQPLKPPPLTHSAASETTVQ